MHLVEAEETLDFADHALNTTERIGEIWFTLTELAPHHFRGYLGAVSNPNAPNDLPSDTEPNQG